MKICPVCDRPSEELVGQDDVLMCPRCAAAVEVEPSLRCLDAGSWKDSESASEGDGGRGSLGSLGKVGLAVFLGAAFFAGTWLVIAPSGPRKPPPVPREDSPVVTEEAAKAAPEPPLPAPAPPPPAPVAAEEEVKRAPPPVPTLRDRAREMGKEAAARVSALAAPGGGVAGDVRKRLEAAAEVERLLAQAVLMAPDLPDLAFTQGRLFTALGRLDEAYAAYDRALKADPDRLDALAAQGWVLTTAHYAAESARGAYPETAKALRKRMADRHGGAAPIPAWNATADLLRKAFQGVARGEFEAARARLDALSRDSCPGWLWAEIPVFSGAWSELGQPVRRGPPPLRPGMPAGPFELEHRIWRRLAQFVMRQRARRPLPGVAPEGGALHASVLRIDAALLAEAGRPEEALEKLDLALAAAADDLFARLDRARVLARLGRKEAALRQYDEAAGRAAALGLPLEVADEIASLRSRPTK